MKIKRPWDMGKGKQEQRLAAVIAIHTQTTKNQFFSSNDENI